MKIVTLAALAAASILLAGCATSTLQAISKNQGCTTKINGEMSFGSITPTGKVKFSATCKPSESSPPLSTVAVPAPVEATPNP